MFKLQEFPHKDSIKLVLFDFDGVFTDNSVWIAENGSEIVRCSRYDGFGLSALLKSGLNLAVLTSETKPLAKHRCEKLRITCYDSLDCKVAKANLLLSDLELSLSETCFFGNDINDLDLLLSVGFPVITPDSHPSLKNFPFYVSTLNGGFGCVRELCDFLVSH